MQDISENEPKRIQLSRRRGWRMPSNTIKVDRSNKEFGNPIKVEKTVSGQWRCYEITSGSTCGTADTKLQATKIAVELFQQQFDGDVSSLRGKNLACWCSLDSPCHANVLLKLANG